MNGELLLSGPEQHGVVALGCQVGEKASRVWSVSPVHLYNISSATVSALFLPYLCYCNSNGCMSGETPPVSKCVCALSCLLGYWTTHYQSWTETGALLQRTEGLDLRLVRGARGNVASTCVTGRPMHLWLKCNAGISLNPTYTGVCPFATIINVIDCNILYISWDWFINCRIDCDLLSCERGHTHSHIF